MCMIVCAGVCECVCIAEPVLRPVVAFSLFSSIHSHVQELLFDLIQAANYMDIKPLLELTCAKVASMMKGKTAEEIRELFNIENDFTPEEKEAIRQEQEWTES